jgi:hypothetical protein
MFYPFNILWKTVKDFKRTHELNFAQTMKILQKPRIFGGIATFKTLRPL